MTLTRATILIIDDNPENLIVLASALESEYDCRLASSGHQGMALALQSPPDLILLDVMMPEVDGFTTCRQIKANPRLSRIPLIFLTALADMETEIAGLTLGAVDYITKPINVALVKQRVLNILRLTQLSRDLELSEERLRLVVETTGYGLWDWHIPTGIVHHNPAWCQILGLDLGFMQHSLELFKGYIHPDDIEDVNRRLTESLQSSAPYEAEFRMRRADGSYVWVSDRGNVAERDEAGAPLRMLGMIANIEERKLQEAEINKLAYFDALTGLPNRRLLIDRLEQTIVRNQRSMKLSAFMFLDMDRFKMLNDTHGHAMGDLLLMQVASRVLNCVRKQDTVARMGGDEFVVMLDGLSESAETAASQAHVVGHKILAVLNEPYQLDTLTYHSTPSIGVTIFAGKGEETDPVISRADAAMYQAKAGGRNKVFMSTELPVLT